jgi:hypothetical protein
MEVRLLEDCQTSVSVGSEMDRASFCRRRQAFDVELVPAS